MIRKQNPATSTIKSSDGPSIPIPLESSGKQAKWVAVSLNFTVDVIAQTKTATADPSGYDKNLTFPEATTTWSMLAFGGIVNNNGDYSFVPIIAGVVSDDIWFKVNEQVPEPLSPPGKIFNNEFDEFTSHLIAF